MTILVPTSEEPDAGGARRGLRPGALQRLWGRAKAPLVVVGLLLWTLIAANGGMKGAGVGAVISIAVAVGILARPGLQRWLFTASPTGDVPPPRHGAFITDVAARTTATRPREIVTGVVLMLITVGLAAGVASLGEKALVILFGLILLLGTIALVKNRSLFFMFAFAASFTLILYKKFTPILSESYAVAIYITTVDVVLLFCYLIWASEGTLFQDLRKGLKNPVFMLPVAGIAVTFLSAINASDQRLVWAEIIRYLWMTALFVWVGIRVRRREHIWAFMLGWLFFLSMQSLIAFSQKLTGGFLGIEILALKPDPYEPALAAEYMRPFGTQIHPVFLACVVGMAGAMIIGFALHVPRRTFARYLLLSCIPIAVLLSYFAKARGPLVALAPTLVVFLFLAARKRFISPRLILVGLLVALIGAGFMHRQVEDTLKPLFGGASNAGENWNCRWQINLIGYRMFRENPVVGAGINSFEREMPRYIYEENACDFRPPHNLFVLTAAETGVVGLGLVITIGLIFGRYALRLYRSRDPMYASLGIGALTLLVFTVAEEVNSFSIKQDIPLAMFWTAFGLVVAANRMMDEGVPDLPRVSWRAKDTEDTEDADPAQSGGEDLVGAGR